MSELCLKILDRDWKTLAVSRGDDEVNLVFSQEYAEGDRIILETAKKGQYVWLQLDDALGKSLVYLTGNVTYIVPFGEKRINLSPKVFYGKKHLLTARAAKDDEIAAYRNLALNACDQHEITFEAKQVMWLEMHDMKKSNEPSPFPALSQIEVYGKEL